MGMVWYGTVGYGTARYLTGQVPQGEEAGLEAYEELGGVRGVLWGGGGWCGAA